MSMKKKSALVYRNIPSGIRPVSYSDRLPVPESPVNFTRCSDEEDSVSSNSEKSSPQLQELQTNTDSTNHKITEGELNDFIRDLEIPKNKAELLASMLQQWNLLHHSTNVTTFRTRNQEFEQFLKTVVYFA